MVRNHIGSGQERSHNTVMKLETKIHQSQYFRIQTEYMNRNQPASLHRDSTFRSTFLIVLIRDTKSSTSEQIKFSFMYFLFSDVMLYNMEYLARGLKIFCCCFLLSILATKFYNNSEQPFRVRTRACQMPDGIILLVIPYTYRVIYCTIPDSVVAFFSYTVKNY